MNALLKQQYYVYFLEGRKCQTTKFIQMLNTFSMNYLVHVFEILK